MDFNLKGEYVAVHSKILWWCTEFLNGEVYSSGYVNLYSPAGFVVDVVEGRLAFDLQGSRVVSRSVNA
jgi:hypothetical protein